MDDDDMFLDNAEDMILLLLKRYGQHAGVQDMYEDDKLIDKLVDFSGTFCPTLFVIKFLKQKSDCPEIYDCDCIFVKKLSKGGRGIPNYYDDFGFDNDVQPYIYRREHDVERDWGKDSDEASS